MQGLLDATPISAPVGVQVCSAAAALLVALSAHRIARRGEFAFLDICCINQLDPVKKVEGIQSLGALLDRSTLPPEAGLALHLLREKRLGKRSKWAPFVASVPPEYSSAPYWGEAELNALQVSAARPTTESCFY